jgi:hypothetical protein
MHRIHTDGDGRRHLRVRRHFLPMRKRDDDAHDDLSKVLGTSV